MLNTTDMSMRNINWFYVGGIIAKLIPFFVAVVVFFTDFIPVEHDIVGVLIKCLPILCLILFVGLQTINYEKQYKWFCYIIMCGLFFGSIGDALLYIGHFVEGAGSFAIGHIFYITAYGVLPIAWILGIVYWAAVIGLAIYIVPYVDGVMIVGIPIYGFVIVSMLWRASARLYIKKEWTFTKWIVVFGGLNFVVSDTLIALNMFVTDVPHSGYLIMGTYYTAQLGMALSVLDPRVPERRKDFSRCTIFYC